MDLTISNPAECAIEYPCEAIMAALCDGRIFANKPDPQGLGEARASIAEMHGHGLGPGDIQLTASTSEAYSILFKLLADPGDNIVTPTPAYPLLEWLARLEGIVCNPAPSLWHGCWSLDFEAIAGACNQKTRAIVVVNPNNPTGRYLDKSEWHALLELASSKDLPLIVDEVFSCYPLEPQNEALTTVLDGPYPPCPVFLLSGLSKVALLPQLKLGWIVLLGEAHGAMEAMAFVADQYLSVSAPTAFATGRLLAMAPDMQARLLARMRKNLTTLDGLLKGYPHLSRLPVHGGWTVMLQRPDIEDDDACVLRLLSEHHLLTYPGHFFDVPKQGFLAASLLPEPSTFSRAVRVLLDGLKLT